MDYEKKYKEAFERARHLHQDAIDMEESLLSKQCEIIFPELKKSENENIRKALIDYFNDFTLPTFEGLEPKKNSCLA